MHTYRYTHTQSPPFSQSSDPALSDHAGYPYYQAPEMAAGQYYDGKVDVFSCGILLADIVVKCLAGTGKPAIRDPLAVYVPPRLALLHSPHTV